MKIDYHAPDMTYTWKPMEGMQGPEQGLVGESRSDSETRPAEETKPGERGIGEIVERNALRRTVERMRDEARDKAGPPAWAMSSKNTAFWHGQAAALGNVLEYIERITAERSDLSNAIGMAAGAGGPPMLAEEKP